MKWYQIALKALPAIEALLVVTVPAAAPVIPFINSAIKHAQELHGDTNNDAKKQLVFDATGALDATGKVQLPPAAIRAITNAVFDTIDHVKTIVEMNEAAMLTNTDPGDETDPRTTA